MDFKTFVRRPYTVQAVEITAENIEEVAKYVGELREKGDGTPYILVESRLVPNVKMVYIGFYMTKMGGNVHCYSRWNFNNRFMPEDEDTQAWVEISEKTKPKPYRHYH